MSQFSTQQVFDEAVGGIIKQGRASYVEFGDNRSPRYRDDNGNKCPVGFLINDSEYSYKLEGFGVDESQEVQDALSNSGVDSLDLSLLQRLQLAHDDIVLNYMTVHGPECFMPVFLVKARGIATQFGLEYDEKRLYLFDD